MPETVRNRISINRLHATYLVSHNASSAQKTKQKLDGAISSGLSSALATTGSLHVEANNTELWFIKELRLKLKLNAALDGSRIRSSVATEILRKMMQIIAEGSNGDTVRCFPDWNTYLGSFLADLAHAQAWQSWYYSRFAGLQSLPISSAIHTAIANNPNHADAALATLSPPDRQKLIDTLAPLDAKRILGTLSGRRSADVQRCINAAISAYATTGGPASAGDNTHRLALALYLVARNLDPHASGRSLVESCLVLQALIELASRPGDEGQLKLREALLNVEGKGTGGIASSDVASALGHPDYANSEVLAPMLRAVLDDQESVDPSRQVKPGVPRSTAFGGLFLILPHIDDLNIDAATEGWPSHGGCSASSLVRLLLAVAAIGGARKRQMIRDPLTRDLLGIEPSADISALQQWSQQIPSEHCKFFVEKLDKAARPDCEKNVSYLASIPSRGAPIAVLMNLANGMWRFATGYKRRNIGILAEQVKKWLSADRADRANRRSLIIDSALADALCPQLDKFEIINSVSDTASESIEAGTMDATFFERRDFIARDWHFLSMTGVEIPRQFQIALTIGAQQILRRFAARLPGFGATNLAHLHRNFLCISAMLETEEDRNVVKLSRAPLDIILSVSGVTRSTLQIDWLGDNPYHLFPQE